MAAYHPVPPRGPSGMNAMAPSPTPARFREQQRPVTPAPKGAMRVHHQLQSPDHHQQRAARPVLHHAPAPNSPFGSGISGLSNGSSGSSGGGQVRVPVHHQPVGGGVSGGVMSKNPSVAGVYATTPGGSGSTSRAAPSVASRPMPGASRPDQGPYVFHSSHGSVSGSSGVVGPRTSSLTDPSLQTPPPAMGPPMVFRLPPGAPPPHPYYGAGGGPPIFPGYPQAMYPKTPQSKTLHKR
mmetsp:Transcript_9684/g.23654  ORF Transcript_9684/g.23654 Transcript_9684/m.23654 type:complete len:238 (-) Transcript_9684:59-772(-)